MMTISGVSVTPDRGTIPPLEDFAYGLKQIVRFGGQTVVSWTVIQHLLACMQVAREEHRTQSILPALEEMYCGMHDMHEALTSDVPNGFKTESFEELQDDLDVRIWRRFGLPSLDGQLAMREYIKQVDRRMLLAEAAVVTPARTYAAIQRKTNAVARPGDIEVVHEVLHTRYPEAVWLARMRDIIVRNGGRLPVQLGDIRA